MNCKCKKIIPQARLDLGYTVCVECSTVEKLGCIDTINHKTGNTIQVMSRDDADQALKLTKRAGFGTLRSLRGASVKSNTKILHGCRLTSIGNQKLYEQVGKTYVDYYDVDTKLAEKYLLRMLNNLEINQLQYNTIKKLSEIIIK